MARKQLTLRIETDLLEQIETTAAADKRSRSNLICLLCSEAMEMRRLKRNTSVTITDKPLIHEQC